MTQGITRTHVTAAKNNVRGPAWYFGWVALAGAALTMAYCLFAMVMARYDFIPKVAGFKPLMQSFLFVGVTSLVAIAAMLLGMKRKTGNMGPAIVALVLSLLWAGVLVVNIVIPGVSAPKLHDITTDLDDPPPFAALTLPKNNLRGVGSVEEWRERHRLGYPDIAPVIIDRGSREVIAAARALAEDRGWTISTFDLDTGHMEAIAYAGFIRFRDYVVIEATPIADGSTRVDMRSTSEVGVSDLGYNAQRIRDFLADLQTSEG